MIALDDAINVEWPGVTEAIFDFLSRDKRFCAIVAGFNKMFIVRRKFAELYTQQIDSKELRRKYNMLYPWRLKTLPFKDHPLRIFYIPPYVSITYLHQKLLRYYMHHTWPKHPLLRPLVILAKSVVREKK